MKASFVIATYNRADDLERCLDSILLQKGCEVEIIVIDDASTDRTCAMLKQKYASRVHLIARELNRGSIKNRNYGASQATGEILFLIDDDTELPGVDTAAEVVGEFSDPRVGAVAIPYVQDGELRQSAPSASADDGAFVAASYIGCACAVRRDTFMALGGYDEFFHHQVEEDDFCIRMLDHGKVCKIARVSEPMQHYESPVRNFQKWDYYGRRNSLLYIWKNAPAIYLWPNLLVTTVRGVGHAFHIRRFRGNFRGMLDGYGTILKSLCGRGSWRRPVRKAVYDCALKLRKGVFSMAELESMLDISRQQ